MAQKDITEKLLEDYEDVFADIVNVLLFQGKTQIRADRLEDASERSQYKADDTRLHEQERDVAKFWRDGKLRIALVGLENQTRADPDMPLRVISYDGAAYRSQLLKGPGEKYPAVTLVLYYGSSHWNGPRTLHERIPVPEALKEHCSDYRINLFEIAFLPEEQIQQFQSDFRIVADFFRQQRVYGDYIPDQRTIRHVDAVLKFLSVFTDDERFSEAARVFQAEKKEETTMTKVLDRVENRGIQKGMQEGIQKGIQRGITETKLQLYQAMRNRGLSEQEALAFAESVAEKAAQALRERE